MQQEPQTVQRYTQTITERYIAAPSREILIDYFRGFAIALMIFTHVVGLTYSGFNDTVQDLANIGGIASFTMFLFISGVGAYYGFLSVDDKEKVQKRKVKILARVIQILGIYYVLALASIFVLGNTGTYIPSELPNGNLAEGIPKLLFFINVPEYTEFLIPLAFFGLSLIALRPMYRFLMKNPLVGIATMVGTYTFGMLLSTVTFDAEVFNALKALVAGGANNPNENIELHAFPILQYFPIYLLGMYLGNFWANNTDTFKRLKVTFLWAFAATAFTVQAQFVFDELGYDIFRASLEGRFPPSLGFISLSMAIALGALFVLGVVRAFIPGFIKAALHFMGTNPVEMFFMHLAILFGLRYLTQDEAISNDPGLQFAGLFEIIIFYFVVLGLSIILTNAKNQFRDWSLAESDTQLWWIFTEKALSTFVFLTIFAVVGSTFYRDVLAEGSASTSSQVQFKKRLIREEEWPFWWDHTYNAFRQITIEPTETISEDAWIQTSFDHAGAVASGRSINSNGEDVRVVYYDELQGVFLELPFSLNSPNSAETTVTFQTQEVIPANEFEDTYFIYYGKSNNGNYPRTEVEPSNVITSNITTLAESTHSASASTNDLWFLRKKETAFQAANLTFASEIVSDDVSASPIVTYTIPGTDKFGRMDNVGDRRYQADIVVSDLDPGIYTIQANVTEPGDNLKIVRSKEIEFYVTYPLYVTWTQDWEGFDVSDSNLNAMANTADTYGMPMVHLFNPRIYVDNQFSYQSISENRALFLTNYVKNRQKNQFEEIGMHIHMFADMVQAAGVQPKFQPVVGAAYGDDITYLYSEEELEQIFRWSREQFGNNDLGAPISYRTAGWMSGPNVLKAAQDTGFLIDTTGRTSGPINPVVASSTSVPWNLSETTYPYLPSVNDINSWEGERLDIWEFPNNGADSYWFSEAELRRRFDVNYPNKNEVLLRPQVVTYLTHPHWYQSVDEVKIRGLFSYVSQFKQEDDNGPVVFATLEEIYAQWPRDTYFNGD